MRLRITGTIDFDDGWMERETRRWMDWGLPEADARTRAVSDYVRGLGIAATTVEVVQMETNPGGIAGGVLDGSYDSGMGV